MTDSGISAAAARAHDVKSVLEDEEDGKRALHVLVAVTGSVASVKLPLLVDCLSATFNTRMQEQRSTLRNRFPSGIKVRVVTTSSAQHFYDKGEVEQKIGAPIWNDEDEWSMWQRMGDPVLHIELRRWADVCLIAPLDANTMAKMANGMSDNLISCLTRCWDFTLAPMIVAPAMNTLMWESPFTAQHLERLKEVGADVIPPISKTLACGDTGVGAMEQVDKIASYVIDKAESWPYHGM
eukprot:Clim_evm34s251 gene=Clim_evmTU34s251